MQREERSLSAAADCVLSINTVETRPGVSPLQHQEVLAQGEVLQEKITSY